MSHISLPLLGRRADAPFPPTSEALRQPNGLLAFGGGLEPERLLAAYRRGIFPWYSQGEPILWWSPSPRCVFLPSQLRVSRRTRRRFNSGCYRLTADCAFDAVVRACAGRRPGQRGTWITDELRQAFGALHAAGHAHSIEVWHREALVGGIYGLALGRVFFGESMFSHADDASKIALAALCRQLAEWRFGLLDAQVTSPHLLSLGAVEWPRDLFESALDRQVTEPGIPGHWRDRFSPAKRW